jgi:hypothetical protein
MRLFLLSAFVAQLFFSTTLSESSYRRSPVPQHDDTGTDGKPYVQIVANDLVVQSESTAHNALKTAEGVHADSDTVLLDHEP